MTDDASTPQLQQARKDTRFKPGDPRINRTGIRAPSPFEVFRDLAIALAWETATDKEGNPILAQGRMMSRAERILIDWLNSNDPRKQELAIRYAFGAVPVENRIVGKDGEALSPLILLLENIRQAALPPAAEPLTIDAITTTAADEDPTL